MGQNSTSLCLSPTPFRRFGSKQHLIFLVPFLANNLSNLSQLFDAGRFPGGVEYVPTQEAAVMMPENGSLQGVMD